MGYQNLLDKESNLTTELHLQSFGLFCFVLFFGQVVQCCVELLIFLFLFHELLII